MEYFIEDHLRRSTINKVKKSQKVEQKIGGNNVLGLDSLSALPNLLRDVLYLDA